MLRLTKLDQSSIIVNPEAIKYAEAIPDTLIIFLNGDTLIVRESLEDIIQKSTELRAQKKQPLPKAQQISPGDETPR
ncbi:MAG: flagellar FlbD family protein [Deltaproteobacteria bacterium]|nr:flagellar FlbD family protein [Deltaproteobacteria bacterium]